MLSTDAGFRPDPAFETGSTAAYEGPLSHVRLQDDARFPWLILIPRRTEVFELDQLSPTDRATLLDEIVEAGVRVRALGVAAGRPMEKLNVAALGNVTRQLHVHVVGRRSDDPLWPDPVWGRGPAEPYDPDRLAAALRLLRAAESA